MSDLKRFDMNGTPHVNGHYCNAQQAADLIEQQQARIVELEQELKIARRTAGIFNTKADELAATVGYLRSILDDIDYELSNHTEHADCLIDIRACIKDFHAVKDLQPATKG